MVVVLILPSANNFALLTPAKSGCFGVHHTAPSKKAKFEHEESVMRPFFIIIISSVFDSFNGLRSADRLANLKL